MLGIDTLIERRTQTARWLYIVAAVPLLLFALIGANYGAFWDYALLAAVCVVQFLRPTLLGWGLVTIIMLVGAGLYLYTAVADVFRLSRGEHLRLFLNPYDTTAFGLLILLVVGIAVALLFHRPRHVPHP